MGSGSWSKQDYRQFIDEATDKGTRSAFQYSQQMQQTADEERTAHPYMDPRNKPRRECRDLIEKLVRAIIWGLDETGSMDKNPGILIKILDELVTLLTDGGYIENPEVLSVAFGDIPNGEAAPLQVGEFEADVRIAEWISRIFIENKGGGTGQESSQMVLFLAARQIDADPWEKRQEKGYLFLITDEAPYPHVFQN